MKRYNTGIVDVADPMTWKGRDTLTVSRHGDCRELTHDYVCVSARENGWMSVARRYDDFRRKLYVAGLL